MTKLGLANETVGDGQRWKFIGIWSKNRWEWLVTHIANMYFKHTSIGFFDSMGFQAVDYILQQTELTCMFASSDYIAKVCSMKKEGHAKSITSFVTFDPVTAAERALCEAVGVKIYDFQEVVDCGAENSDIQFDKCTERDCPIFSYTSGTTGDSKGVKLNHMNLFSSSRDIQPLCPLTQEESYISYLPYPHSFEQCLLYLSIQRGCKIGFYQGDPLKLTEDCAILKPSLFASVPRIFNKIYDKITSIIGEYNGDPSQLAKFKNLLGDKVRFMITGSAPIDPAVLNLLKVAFQCPIFEGYGLTENAAASAFTALEDPNTGHVGGPLNGMKYRLMDVTEMSYLHTDKPYPRGELCMKGQSLFSGYYSRPDKTAEAFDAEGWFMTGDVAMVYPNGSVRIIDRSKNIFKLSQGEYIAPEKVEGVYVLSQFIAQNLIYGDSLRSCTVGIVVPDFDNAKKWATANGKLFFKPHSLAIFQANLWKQKVFCRTPTSRK